MEPPTLKAEPATEIALVFDHSAELLPVLMLSVPPPEILMGPALVKLVTAVEPPPVMVRLLPFVAATVPLLLPSPNPTAMVPTLVELARIWPSLKMASEEGLPT